jgi:hypothetical protein
MFGSSIDLESLRACLANTTPVDLLGMRLLREQPHLFRTSLPVPREQLVEAVTEIVDYTGRCTTAARQLANLTPISLKTMTVLEFGL